MSPKAQGQPPLGRDEIILPPRRLLRKRIASMTLRKMLALASLTVALGIAGSLPSIQAQPANAPLKVGMAKTFFNDLPKPMIEIAVGPFGDLMKASTGFDGILSTDDPYVDVAQKLYDGKLQMGVFHGHELAWIQKRFPKLTPLMIATNKQHDVSAYVIVHKDSPAKTITDLRGKKLDLPLGTKEHCRIFLRQNCKDNAQNDLDAFFGKVIKSSSSIDGLDDVCRTKADAIIVDTIALNFYKDIKGPFFEKNLRILAEHRRFPSPVIVYCQGGLNDATVAKIRDGMTAAHENPKCKEMLDLWQIDAFAPIPKTYAAELAETLKTFLPPEATKVSQR
jgi:ABC-type phosphate/phosphonate transport system substrate-binding protein